MNRLALLLGAASMLVAAPGFATSGDGVGAGNGVLLQQAATLQPSDWVWRDDGGTGPLSIVISLPDQRAYVYRGGTMIAVSSVSTGRDGKETPVGVFPILEKEVKHRSTLYDSAPMPYMERLTWDGVAIHGGSTPGYRTSHGCIHVPLAFAKKLYGATEVGTVVEVTDASVVDADPAMLPPEPYVEDSPAADANAQVLSSIGQDLE